MTLKPLRPNNFNRFRRQRRTIRRRQRDGAQLARRLRPVITFVALAVLFAMQGFLKAASPREEFAGVVRRVVDGDTLHLHGVAEPLRLWGVDAPELGEPGGFKSADHLQSLVAGRRLACKEMDIDRYQRIVARCLIAETGEEVNALMIEQGGAAEYVHYTGGYYLWRRLAG
jgi:endonuclease YncB( thermonuclease family)